MPFFDPHLRAPTSAGSAPGREGHVVVGPLSVLDGTLADAAALCVAAIAARTGARVATANLDFVARARRDRVLRADLATSHLVVADGAPVAWLARLAGGNRTRRATGVDLIAAICRRASVEAPLRAVLYGSAPDVAEAAAARIAAANPGVTIAAVICPPFAPLTAGQSREYADRVSAASPGLVLVALGCPRQERFIAEHYAEAPQAVWIGVGGSFDFYAGKRRRAPAFVGASGAEWLVRLAQEPRRLWRRYLLRDLPTLLVVAPGVFFRRMRRSPAAQGGGEMAAAATGPGRPGAEDEVSSAAL